MADEIDPRLARGMTTAIKLFTPKSGAPNPPSFKYPKEIAEAWNQLSISTVMGDVWGREALDPKQRAMITIGVLTALDKPAQLRQYITGGLNLGLTRFELIGTKAACQFLGHLSKVLIFGLGGFAFGAHAGLLAVLCACVVGGTWLGSHVLHHVNERMFTWLYRSVLTVVALRLVATPLWASWG